MNKDIILSVEDIDVYYGDFLAIHNVSMNVKAGTITSIIGANGAGKTTLLDTIMGLNKPRKGKIVFEGEDITGMRTRIKKSG
jgi:branched-chain amino acid transport system ATP-binding protein